MISSISSESRPFKILVVAPSWVGDLVMAQTLFKLLKQQRVDCKIEALVPSWSAGLISRMPEVEHAILLPFRHGELKLKERYQFAKRLRERGYDQAIILPNSFKSSWIPYWAKIPVITGWLGELPRFFLLNDVRRLNPKAFPRMVQRFAALAFPKKSALPNSLPFPRLTTDLVQQEKTLSKYHLTLSKKILMLAPGAEFGPSKRWPVDYYAAVANNKIQQGWQVWLLGSINDQMITQKIVALTDFQAIDLAGKTTLEEVVDLMALATLVLTNDSGLMHVAAAVDVPVMALYGSTSPEFTPPLSEKAKIIGLHLSCSPCFKRICPLGHGRCMKDISPQRVLDEIST